MYQVPLTPEQEALMPGDRVLAYEHLWYKDDIKTPVTMLMKPATVIKRYGELERKYDDPDIPSYGPYPDMVDVLFDHVRFPHAKGELRYLSKGHFTYGVIPMGDK